MWVFIGNNRRSFGVVVVVHFVSLSLLLSMSSLLVVVVLLSSLLSSVLLFSVWCCHGRPKLCRAGEGAKDFRIDTNLIDGTERGAAISLYGIESPGLTSALALSSHVAQLLRMQ